MHRTIWIKLLLVVGLLLTTPAQAQGQCEAGFELVLVDTLEQNRTPSFSFGRSGYVVLAGINFWYAVNGGSQQLFFATSEIRVDLASGDTVQYGAWSGGTLSATHCMEPPPPTATPDPSLPTPTVVAYPMPIPPTSSPSEPSNTPTTAVVAYPPPTPLPTIEPDAIFDALSSHGQAVTAVGASSVGIAIISVLLLWAGMRMLFWWRRRR